MRKGRYNERENKECETNLEFMIDLVNAKIYSNLKPNPRNNNES